MYKMHPAFPMEIPGFVSPAGLIHLPTGFVFRFFNKRFVAAAAQFPEIL
jgi:hypothetical protein